MAINHSVVFQMDFHRRIVEKSTKEIISRNLKKKTQKLRFSHLRDAVQSENVY